ncbi:MAG TPA: phosphoribosylamine--glycine ligase [Bryobacteraceae bacterium]|nr:phosphoribosylamine--glycine ligase [Bryobacteraceae bacterium]
MKILVIGSGGREHALAWRLAQSPAVRQVYAAPGNPGIAKVATCVPAGTATPAAYLELADSLGADLTVVGPEAPLVAGVVDTFRAQGRLIFGPTADAARLEGSKIFSKHFFTQRNIPTAAYVTAATTEDARAALDRFGFPVVLKADGLAAGKGVVVAPDRRTAEEALATLKPPFVIEECLQGEEVSFIVLSDGRNVLPLEPTQDHKAVCDDDQGPNTGGMGAYCDSRILTPDQVRFVMDRVIHPTVEATGFTGFLYAGLMMTADGPKVLEFNVRMGDPETQPLMQRLRGDFASVLMAAARGDLAGARLEWDAGPSVCVVLASGGYPGAYPSGKPITGIDEAERTGCTVFHAGTRAGAAGVETAGGRVLGVTASGTDLAAAMEAAYAGVRKIRFDGMHYRTDIGRKGLKRYATM